MSDRPQPTVLSCIRCSGPTYVDPDGDTACMMCGWRDYRAAQLLALEEEERLRVEQAAWLDDGYTGTRASKRLSRRRNR